jgi:adenosylhomocysteine nucleosidase
VAARLVSNDDSLTAIVAAMGEEIAPLRARLVGGRTVAVAGAQVTTGRLGDVPVALIVTGDGDRKARQGLTAALATLRVRRLLVVGVAGGLSANLEVGALVVCSRVIGEIESRVHDPDAALTSLAVRVSGARRGVAITAGRIADTAEDKRRLLAMAKIGAPGAPGRRDAGELVAIVDLESSVFAEVAARAGVPWTVLRAVSDRADESVPALLNRCRDEGGSVRRGLVAWKLLTNVGTLPRLLALGGRVRRCAHVLARAVELMLGALTPGVLAPDTSLSPNTVIIANSDTALAPKEA